MPIILENRVRRMLVFHLPHDVCCRDECACLETTVVLTAENPRTGDRARKHVPRKVPGSMTWLALERRTGLPNTLLEVPEIRAAIARRELRLVEQTPDPAPKSDAAASSPTVPAPVKTAAPSATTTAEESK
jgi:hypothetical protein